MLDSINYEFQTSSGKFEASSSANELDIETGKKEINNDNATQYVYNASGLFPIPFGKSMKSSQINKQKSRFKLLGKFMAKALYDSRMVRLI